MVSPHFFCLPCAAGKFVLEYIRKITHAAGDFTAGCPFFGSAGKDEGGGGKTGKGGAEVAIISMKQLLEAGVHFGHQTRRWNPKMAPYIFTDRNGIYIIDLQKTVKKIEEAYNFVKGLAAEGKTILFVGTKKQAQQSIQEEAERCGMYYVNQRWLGGMLTNFKTIKNRVERLHELERLEESGQLELRPKKEVASLLREKGKLP